MTTWNCLFHTRLLAVGMALQLLVLLSSYFSAEAMHFSVELYLPRFVPRNGSATLRCVHDVPDDELHKVEWLRGSDKMFQFVRNRVPPFRFYAISGAVIDKNRSNEREIVLRDLQLSATGYYSCEVSRRTPIFTKASNDEELVVIQPQRGAPLLSVRQPAYLVGELLEANCTSRPAHPVPHVTWLLNGETVPQNYLRFYPEQPSAAAVAAAAAAAAAAAGSEVGEEEEWAAAVAAVHQPGVGATTVQLALPVVFAHAAADGRLHLACVATIPAFMGLQVAPAQYADYQREDASVEVLQPQIESGQEQTTPPLVFAVFLLILGIQRCLLWR